MSIHDNQTEEEWIEQVQGPMDCPHCEKRIWAIGDEFEVRDAVTYWIIQWEHRVECCKCKTRYTIVIPTGDE